MNLDQLVKRCSKQDIKAQEELYNLYKVPLFALCLKYCSNSSEAEDNLHDSFIEIFASIKKFNGKGSFEGWMKRITINKAITKYKKSYSLVPIKDDYNDEITIDEEVVDFPLNEILKHVQNLPHQYRLVFNLYELEDYSHKEIACMLSISESASKSNLHRAKAKLKEQLLLQKNIQTKKSNGK